MRTLWMCSLAHFVCFVNANYNCLSRWCDTCLPVKVHDAPGVGFDLTPSYGWVYHQTAAVHYYNGTVVEAAKVLGSPEYIELMARLATTSEPLLDSTLGFTSELLSRLAEYILPRTSSPWRDWWRRLNTKLGRPVKADDVQIISDLLQQLKISTENRIAQPLERVAVTDPGFHSLNSATISAALRMSNLRTWLGDSVHYPWRLVEGDTVYAANGYGLCADYSESFHCTNEFDESYHPTIFFVSYSRTLLYASIVEGATAEALAPLTLVEAQLVDYELGLDLLLEKDQDALWDHLRSQLQILPREFGYPVTHVFLAGESVTHPRFLDIFRDAMSKLSLESVNIKSGIDPTFAAARGAALYARRRQEVPGDCMERRECEETRMHERLHTSTREELR
ncbi:hypothetical protein N7517_006172 [Penicillium concentricum]|uniref:Carbohydrate kinase FGGY C-terminal domain-containing protein n=1 Tax=Penicillium concentricum TaxID=293559 RepID=A0A9W9S8Q8_9EURO|nr:uncharacterized protein N7517_006172 [Penicillium concentricum]KAJ5374166.1 hypothetical protein N7517_006172 [Penicillium concentricum]